MEIDASSSKNPSFIGRKKEIDELSESINSEGKSVTLILGELGIGKSFLLQEFYRKLKEDQTRYLVGFYRKTDELRSAKLIHPFITALESLLKWEMESQEFDDRMKQNVKRLENAFVKFVKEEGTKVAGAIIQDVADKVGLKETYKVATDFLKTLKAEKTVTMMAESYIIENKGEIIDSYIHILRSLAQEFQDRSFILIFDQFESVGKASVDFLIDLIVNIPNRFHVVISFRSGESHFGRRSCS